ncbi:hypothetical protein [Methanosphaera sp.]
MIIYFSATGNCKYISKIIANKTNDTISSMIDLIENNQYTIPLEKNEQLCL